MTTTITGDDQWTVPKFFSDRLFTVTIKGTFDATVTIQRVNGSRRTPATDASEWHDVDAYTEESELNGLDSGGHWYRIGVNTGGFVSGPIEVAIY